MSGGGIIMLYYYDTSTDNGETSPDEPTLTVC